MRKLDELLENWDDSAEETSDVHIEEFHYHGPSGDFGQSEIPTKSYNQKPKPPSISPKVRNITLVIIGVATGIAGAIKIVWEAWHSLPK